MTDKRFREGFAVLSRLALSFDAWLDHPRIAELGGLARVFPDTKIVLDPVGGPIGNGAYAGKHKEVLSGWRHPSRHSLRVGTFTSRLADWACALVDSPSTKRPSRRPRRRWRRRGVPMWRPCIEAFGPD
jgi:L-fuconolactonase